MVFEYAIKTEKENFYNITENVHEAINKSGIANGICVVYCPHTTAGITINENADPDVIRDMLLGLNKAFPDRSEFLHRSNSTAHLKASGIGSSVTIIVNDGNLLLGIWQGVYFCEFDGARNRKYYVKVLAD